MTQQPENLPNSEQAPKLTFVSEADMLIDSAGDLDDEQGALDLLAASRSLIDGILEKADKGELKSSDGSTYSSDSMIEQFRALNLAISTPIEGMSPLRTIPNAEGMRRGFDKLLSSEKTGKVFMDAITLTVQEHDRSREEFDEEVAENLGETAVEAVIDDPALVARRVVNYDALLSGEDDNYRSVEGAAIRTSEADAAKQNRLRQQRDAADAANKALDRPEMKS